MKNHNKELEKEILDKVSEYIKKNEGLKEDYHNLLTIPGIGKVSAISLLYLFKNYKDTNRSVYTLNIFYFLLFLVYNYY
jgi:hypothetical protein